MIVVRIFLLAVFLFVAPVMLGAPWTTLLPRKNRYRHWACFPIGVFVQLAIFQLLEVPVAFLRLPFSLLCTTFMIVVAVAGAYSLFFIIKRRPFAVKAPKLNGWDTFYLIVFLGLLGWQVYNGFVRDTTVWSYDDSVYVTYAADAIRFDAIQTINPSTGIATAFNAHRSLQGWLYYPAFLSVISTIPVTVMERTVLQVYDILLAYAVYAYMASVLFRRKDNELIFLIFLSLLHIFGWYSQYSVTFRLLGPGYQGKAVLAVSFFPLLYTLMIQILQRSYSPKIGALLLLLSVAASSLTLFGAAIMVVNASLVTGLSALSRKENRKQMIYIAWACFLPALYCGIYFLYKYGQF